MPNIPFSVRLKDLRLSLGYSQQELGDFLGTTKQVISRYENGLRSPKISVVAEYAKKLNVNVAWLLGDPDATQDPPDPQIKEAPLPEGLSDVKQLLIEEILSADDADIADLISYLKVKKGITLSDP